jgi:hypothetical protein
MRIAFVDEVVLLQQLVDGLYDGPAVEQRLEEETLVGCVNIVSVGRALPLPLSRHRVALRKRTFCGAEAVRTALAEARRDIQSLQRYIMPCTDEIAAASR